METQNKNILEGRSGPVTQSVASVKSLLTYVGRGCDPLPEFVEMGKGDGKVVLVLSNKHDVYYTTTSERCSCPAATYHQGPCKHQRKHFGVSPPTSSRRCAEVGGSIRPTGSFKPFDSLPGEEAAEAVPSMLIDLHDTTAREAAYHSIKEDKAMWPQEA